MSPRAVAALAAVALTITACAGSSTGPRTSTGRLAVVAGFYPIAEAVTRVGGDRVAVENLTPAGAEPHDLELSPDQADSIQDAGAVFVMGRGFQPAVEKAATERDGPSVELLDRLPITRRSSGVLDPHVWLDPVLYADLVRVVARELARVDPEGARAFARNADAFTAEIAATGARYAEGLRDCARRTMVTSHAAFGYLARRYDLRQESIVGIAPDEEPSAGRMADLADLVQRLGITTIFTEELVSPRVADALAREAGGVRTATLNPLEGLSEEQQARGADWSSVMDSNLVKLRAALGCT
jgi:zinc transport system substrate-binding protein